MDVVAFLVEFGQFASEVRAHVPNDLFREVQGASPRKVWCRYLVTRTTCAHGTKTHAC